MNCQMYIKNFISDENFISFFARIEIQLLIFVCDLRLHLSVLMPAVIADGFITKNLNS